MKVKIISGEFEGKSGTVVGEWQGEQPKLAGGKSPSHAVTVQVDGQLQPIEFDASEVQVLTETH